MLLKFDLDKEVERFKDYDKNLLKIAFDEYYKNMSPSGCCTINRKANFSYPINMMEFTTLRPEDVLGFFTLKEDMILDINWIVNLEEEYSYFTEYLKDGKIAEDDLFLTGRWLYNWCYGADSCKLIGIFLNIRPK